MVRRASLLALFALHAAADPKKPVPDASRMKPAELADAAETSLREGDLNRAAYLFEACLEREPANADCTVKAAATYARRAAELSSDTDREHARALYERFLFLADPKDPRVPRVRGILGKSEATFVRSPKPVVMPPALTLSLKETRAIEISILRQYENDAPDVVAVTMPSDTKLVLSAQKRGVATLKLFDPDGSFHLLKVTVQ